MHYFILIDTYYTPISGIYIFTFFYCPKQFLKNNELIYFISFFSGAVQNFFCHCHIMHNAMEFNWKNSNVSSQSQLQNIYLVILLEGKKRKYDSRPS